MNSDQASGGPLLNKLNDIRSTTTMIEELVELQSEVVYHCETLSAIYCFLFDSNTGRFIYIE